MGTVINTMIVFLFGLITLSVPAQNLLENADFEMGDFTNWTAKNGSWNEETGNIITWHNDDFEDTSQAIIDTFYMDPNTCYNLPSIPPGGGNYVAKLGNNVNGHQAEALTYTLTVTAENALFLYRYAVVFEEPDHDPDEQPFFELAIRNLAGEVLDSTCGYMKMISGTNMEAFDSCSVPKEGGKGGRMSLVRYKPWSTVAVDLSAYIGQIVQLEFVNADCSHGGHWAYSYMEAFTANFELSVKACETDKFATLEAPEGFTSYLWNTGETSRIIQVDNPLDGAAYFCDMYTLPECSVRLEATIQIEKQNFNFVDITTCEGAATTLTASGSSEYIWSDGLGTGTSVVVHPVIDTKYSVTAVGDNSCGDVTEFNVKVNTLPTTTVTNASICEGELVQLTAGGALTYAWSDGLGTDSQIMVAPTQTESYEVTGTDANGCQSTATSTVTVQPLIYPKVKIQVDKDIVCPNTPITFSASLIENAGNNPRFDWYVRDQLVATGVSKITTDTLSNLAEIKLQLTANDYCISTIPAADSLLVHILPYSVPNIELQSDPPNLCEKVYTRFTASNVSGAGTNPSYEWLINGSLVGSNQTTISTDTLSAGSKVAVVVHSNAPCPLPETDTAVLVVKPLPQPKITVEPEMCSDGGLTPIVVTNQLPTGGSYSIEPTVGLVEQGGAYFFDPNRVGGTYPIQIQWTDANGCIAPAQASVKVLELLHPYVKIQTDKNNVCEGELITLSVANIGNTGPNPIKQWYINDKLVAQNTDVIATDTLHKTAHVRLVVTATAACVSPLPVADALVLQLVPNESPNIELRAVPGNICEKTLTSFISDNISGAGLLPGLEWLINGVSLSTQAAYLSTDTLSAGTEVAVVVHSNAQCPFPMTDTARLVVNPKPQPEVTVTPHICNDAPRTPITVRDIRNTGGGYEFYTVEGIEQEATAAFFNPNQLADGYYPIGVEWTNSFGCKAKAGTSIEVHSIDPPVAKESYQSIIGYLPYEELTASGIGSLMWYDSTKTKVGAGPIYKPELDCNGNECQFTFYVNQVLEPWGCESPYVSVVYTLTGCSVGLPLVHDYKICDYNPIPSLHADTAQIWSNGAPIRGTSTLYWYKNFNDATDNYIHSGLSDYQPALTNTVGEYSWWVRQYNSTLGCFSSPVKVKLSIISTPPPTIENTPQNYCQGQENPTAFIAKGENIAWYLQPDTSTAVFKSGNSLLPTIPDDWHDYYYASQTKNGCKSPPVPARISIMPKAETPVLQGGESCDQAERYFMVALFPVGTSVSWFDHNNILLDKTGEKEFTLQRQWLHPDSVSIFKAIITNDYECPGDTVQASYHLIAIPEAPQVLGDSIICVNEDLSPLIAKTDIRTDSVVWSQDGIHLYQGDTLIMNNVRGGEVYELEVLAYNRYCQGPPTIKEVEVRELPNPAIIGDSTICVPRIQELYRVDSVDTSDYQFSWSVSGEQVIYVLAGNTFNSPAVYIDWIDQGIDTITVTQTDPYGCRNSSSMLVSLAVPPSPDFTYEVFTGNQTIYFRNQSGKTPITDGVYERDLAVDYYWNFNYSNQKQNILQTEAEYYKQIPRNYSYGYYDVMLISENEFYCRDTIIKEVFMDQFMALYVPNAFAPADDAPFVRWFHPTGLGIAKYKIWIYDKWGNFIWYSDKLTEQGTPAEGWDGRYDGIMMQSDSYIWKIEASFIDGSNWKGVDGHNFGSVLLLR